MTTRPAAVLEKMIEELEGQKDVRPPYCRPPKIEGGVTGPMRGASLQPSFRVHDISRRHAIAKQIKGLQGELERAKANESN